jgi:hypothetical protein
VIEKFQENACRAVTGGNLSPDRPPTMRAEQDDLRV